MVKLIVAGLMVLAQASSGVLPNGRVVETRPLSAYQGEWSSVQAGGITFRLKGNSFTITGADRAELRHWIGGVQVKDIAATSSAWRPDMSKPAHPSMNVESQAFYGQCAINKPSGPDGMVPTGQYVPCALVLSDSSPQYPPIRKRWEIRLTDPAHRQTYAYKFAYGFFDLRKPG